MSERQSAFVKQIQNGWVIFPNAMGESGELRLIVDDQHYCADLTAVGEKLKDILSEIP